MSPRPVRRTQAITPFGVGAMIDFPGPVSLIHCGLDSYPFNENDKNHREFRIEDENRLAMRLGVKYFVQPPDFRYQHGHEDTKRMNLNLKIPFLRFPKWHVCPRCGIMHEAALHDRAAPTCKGPVGSGKDKGKTHFERKTIQVRFIAACPSGHLQDFPWWEWVMGSPNPQPQGRLRMVTSGSASLAGVRIVYEENTPEIKVITSKTLSGAFEFEPGGPSALSRLQIFCRGDNPALGIPSQTCPSSGCGSHLYPLLRGGTNVYFPHIVSSIYLPPIDSSASDEVLEILEDSIVWSFLSMSAQCAPDGKVNKTLAQTVLEKYYPDREIDPDKLAEAANRRLRGENKKQETVIVTDTPEQAFRREEYELFRCDVMEGYPKTNLLIRGEDVSSYEPVIRDWFQRVSLLHKLRETRVFVGFSRIFPEDNLDNDQRRALISRTSKEWLPGVIVRGEGIFLQLQEEKIKKWLASNGDELENRIRPISWGSLDLS
jgi:hypothetical protein